jgi:hypothetical protein
MPDVLFYIDMGKFENLSHRINGSPPLYRVRLEPISYPPTLAIPISIEKTDGYCNKYRNSDFLFLENRLYGLESSMSEGKSALVDILANAGSRPRPENIQHVVTLQGGAPLPKDIFVALSGMFSEGDRIEGLNKRYGPFEIRTYRYVRDVNQDEFFKAYVSLRNWILKLLD